MSPLPLLPAQISVVAADEWSHAFKGLDNDQRFVLIIIGMVLLPVTLAVIVGIIAGALSSIHRRRIEVEFKHELLDRGMTAEEIVEVVKAAPVQDAASRWVEGWLNRKYNKGK